MTSEAVLELDIDRLAASGEGVARHEGLVVFVPRALPGDRVRVVVRSRAARHARAEILERLRDGPGRVTPPCVHAESCGGCPWMGLRLEDQRLTKRALLEDALRRVGHLTHWPPVEVIGGRSLGFRVRAEWVCEPRGAGFAWGYRAERSHTLVPVTDCPILVDPLRRALQDGPFAPGTPPRSTRAVQAGAADGGLVHLSPEDLAGRPLDPADDFRTLRRTVAGLALDWPLRGFQQSHAELVEVLVREALHDLPSGPALDLFCGAGLFALPLSARGISVTGVESHAPSVAVARANAERLGLGSRCRFVRSDVARWLGSRPPPAETVIVDPPRAGLGAAVVAQILALAPPYLRHVACDGVTFARDVGALVRGGYRLERLVLVDQFPHTPHIEVVAALIR